jgi:methyl-accepting chemotaxis protein
MRTKEDYVKRIEDKLSGINEKIAEYSSQITTSSEEEMKKVLDELKAQEKKLAEELEEVKASPGAGCESWKSLKQEVESTINYTKEVLDRAKAEFSA